jgi:hypothetical protein
MKTKASQPWAYIVAHNGDGWQTSLWVQTTTGKPAVLMFETREKAKAYCAKFKVRRPWPIKAMTKAECLNLLRRAQAEGTRFLSDGETVADIARFLTAVSNQDARPTSHGPHQRKTR